MSSIRPWYRLRLRTLLALIVLAIVTWSLYSYWSDYSERSSRRARELMAPNAGARCTVIFRSDAVGVDRSGVGALETGGASNYVTGEFVRMNDDWLLINTDEGVRKWIPREQILVLEEELDK